jgi:hypothetical protein
MTQNTWSSGVSGTWSTAADWVGGVPNSITADATITVPGAYTVTLSASTTDTVDSVTLNNSTANFDLLGTLSLGGSLATYMFDGGIVTLGSAGKLSGGTLDIDTGTLLTQGGTIATSDFILGGSASIALVLLCHKFFRSKICWQHGQRGSVREIARAMAMRTEVIEFGT